MIGDVLGCLLFILFTDQPSYANESKEGFFIIID